MNNKKAEIGTQLMFFLFIFVLLLTGIGIVAGVTIFFGREYDFREIDAKILSYKIIKCLEKNKIEKGDAFLKSCGIKEETIGEEIFLKVCINSENCLIETDKNKIIFVKGKNFQLCGFKGAKRNKNYPICIERTFEKLKDEYEIVSASNNKIKLYDA